MLSIEDVVKRRGTRLVLSHVSFRAGPGRVTGFVGPNGAGKSSMLRILLGLDRSTAGTALIGGRPYRSLIEPLRTVGSMLEGPGAHRSRTARNHLAWVARSNGISQRRVAEALELVGLASHGRTRVSRFSLGMGQRLGLATALLGEPEVLVLDEPMNGLDPEGIRWIRNLLRCHADGGGTVLLSSHLMSEVAEIADDLVVITGGRTVASGPIAAVTAGYPSLEDAYFALTGNDQPEAIQEGDAPTGAPTRQHSGVSPRNEAIPEHRVRAYPRKPHVRFGAALAAELRKAATLPATLAALAVAVLGLVGVALLNAVAVRQAVGAGRADLIASGSPADAAFSAVPLGTVGAVILGVVVVSSEYRASGSDAGGRQQISVTLSATPRRLPVLGAKALTTALLVAAVAVVAIPTSLVLAHAVVGDVVTGGATTGAGALEPGGWDDLLGRSVGAWLYWTFTALMALAVTVLARSGMVPLVVLSANSVLVSFSLLLSRLTPLARYLPDLAGTRLFARETSTALADPLSPVSGGLVMAAWTAGLLVVAAVAFTCRDA